MQTRSGGARPTVTLPRRLGSVLYRIALALAITTVLGWCVGELIDLIHPVATDEVHEIEELRSP